MIMANTSSSINYYGNIINSTEPTNKDEYLLRLNNEKVILLSPVIVYVVLAVFIGLCGNTIVCYIYTFRLRRSPSRFFILFLAVLDLISCFVGAGSEITDLFQPYVFKTPWSCRILRFGLSFTIISASFTLICVAFDRYYKVCRPLKAFPVKKVKVLCILVAILSFALSSPALAIFGLKSVPTDISAITGSECSTQDSVKGTPLPIIYYIILFTAFLVLLTTLILLYIRIGHEIWKRKRLTIGETLPYLGKKLHYKNAQKNDSSHAEETSASASPTDDESRGCENQALSQSECSAEATMRNNESSTTKGTKRHTFTFTRRRSQMGRMSIRTVRTTSIFFAVSVAFVLSFLPYLIANVLKFSKVAFHEFPQPSVEIAYNFCVRSYFISNFINPVIYSALNKNFRKECKKLIKRMLKQITTCCCKRDSLKF